MYVKNVLYVLKNIKKPPYKCMIFNFLYKRAFLSEFLLIIMRARGKLSLFLCSSKYI